MNTMINLTKKPTNLFTPNPFNIFKLLSYYSEIDQSNSFLKMENKPIMDIGYLEKPKLFIIFAYNFK